MSDLSARTVFHVSDAERALHFYTNSLGFALDWNHAPDGRAFVFQVSMLGFALIVNEVEAHTQTRSGQGRVFIGIEDDQLEALHSHCQAHNIRCEVIPWGEPTLLIRDLDGNWITFWLPEDARAALVIGERWPK